MSLVDRAVLWWESHRTTGAKWPRHKVRQINTSGIFWVSAMTSHQSALSGFEVCCHSGRADDSRTTCWDGKGEAIPAQPCVRAPLGSPTIRRYVRAHTPFATSRTHWYPSTNHRMVKHMRFQGHFEGLARAARRNVWMDSGVQKDQPGKASSRTHPTSH